MGGYKEEGKTKFLHSQKEGREYKEVGKGGKKKIKLLFWNVAGIGNKGKEFWKYICKFHFVSLSEIWVTKEGWDRIKGKLPSTHKWECIYATKEKAKGGRWEVFY